MMYFALIQIRSGKWFWGRGGRCSEALQYARRNLAAETNGGQEQIVGGPNFWQTNDPDATILEVKWGLEFQSKAPSEKFIPAHNFRSQKTRRSGNGEGKRQQGASGNGRDPCGIGPRHERKAFSNAVAGSFQLDCR